MAPKVRAPGTFMRSRSTGRSISSCCSRRWRRCWRRRDRATTSRPTRSWMRWRTIAGLGGLPGRGDQLGSVGRGRARRSTRDHQAPDAAGHSSVLTGAGHAAPGAGPSTRCAAGDGHLSRLGQAPEPAVRRRSSRRSRPRSTRKSSAKAQRSKDGLNDEKLLAAAPEDRQALIESVSRRADCRGAADARLRRSTCSSR